MGRINRIGAGKGSVAGRGNAGTIRLDKLAKHAPLWLVILSVVLFVGGCSTSQSTGGASSGSVRAIERLDLLLTPMALDLDGRPGMDGFGVRIYASNRKSAFGGPILQGNLEILLYDGTLRAEQLAGVAPLKTWRYAAGELKPFSQKTSIGTSYRFALSWGEQKPKEERITVVARYVGSDNFVVSSAPGAIPLTVK